MNKEIKTKKLGNLYGFTGGSYAGNVYNTAGLCPAINTCGGGNREPMVVVGSTQRNAFIGDGSYCPTLTEAMGMGGGQIPMIVQEKDNENGNYTSRESDGHEQRES